MQIVFSKKIKFNRALGLHGYLFAGVKRPVVDRCVMVVKSEQAGSIMVSRGLPFVAFITANEAFNGDAYSQQHFFATQEAAINFCEAQLKSHPAIVA